MIHGTSVRNTRYLAYHQPVPQGDAEREWPLIGQAALWTNLTDG